MAARPQLSTERLLLRRWRPSDLVPLAEINADPTVMKHFVAPLTRTQSAEQMHNIERGFAQHRFDFWAVELAGAAQLIGFIGVRQVPDRLPFTPAVEIGWRIARRYWGKGLAFEGARASVDYAFGPLELSELVAYTTDTNARSRRLMVRLGMTRDRAGDFLHPLIPEGHPLRPHVLYRLRRDRAQEPRG